MGRVVVLEPAPIPIDWKTQENEWRDLLRQAVDRLRPHTTSGASLVHSGQGPPPYYLLSHDCEPPLASARLYRLDHGMVLAVEDGASEEDRQVWQQALRTATAEVGARPKEIHWVAWTADFEQHGALDRLAELPADWRQTNDRRAEPER